MKKYLFIVWSAVLAIGLTGCKEDTAKVEKANTIDLKAYHQEWQFDENALQFFYHFDIPEITRQVYDYGNWTLSQEFNKGYKNAYQVALPMTYYLSDTLSNGSVVYYSQLIDYRIGVGYVEIQLTNSDYLYPTYPDGTKQKPADMYFRLQLIY